MILVGMGSNLPFCGMEPPSVLQFALDAIARTVDVSAVSRLYRAPSWPDPSLPPYANAVAMVTTQKSPQALLAALRRIENAFSRRRTDPNAPRTLDLDLLAYGEQIMQGDTKEALKLPHPGIAERDFVLAPICDIAPDWRHPLSGRRADDLLSGLQPVSALPMEEFHLTLGPRTARQPTLWRD